jgi:glycosyltransferase involved in cell wall biosynthesis/predicted RNA methylase
MEFTGERVVPDKMSKDDPTYLEHLARYHFALPYCEDKEILDAACGTGYGAAILRDKGFAGNVEGVDISEEAVQYAQENYGIFAVHCDLEKDFPAYPYNLITSFETIEHLQNPGFFLEQAAKNSRQFIFSIPLNNPSQFHKQVYTLEEAKELIYKYFNEVEWFEQTGTEIKPLSSKNPVFILGIAENTTQQKADLVLVSHNSKEDLEKFLPTIRENTKNYNLTIIENGNDNKTKQYLDSLTAQISYVENKGYGSACNTGAGQGNSEFIVFLNCDLLASKNWLVDLLKPFGDGNVAVVGARLFDKKGQEYPTPQKNMAIGCCFAVRRKIFEQLGGFDEKFFLFFEETDFCVRALKAGYKVVRSEAKLTHCHPHFPPLDPHLQKYWDESEVYFKNKHSERTNTKKVALVMCVKNEEKGLKEAIESARKFVDYVLVQIDKKSTDNTAEIAKGLADEIKYFDFENDFSEMRNHAHEDIKQDWILFLDGHETLEKCENLEKFLVPENDGVMCSIEMETGTIFRAIRIYRNGCQFTGAVHEQIDSKAVKFCPSILIKHNRLGTQSIEAIKERDEQRDKMVPEIMEGNYKKGIEQARSAFHLGLHYQARGRFKLAIKWWKKYLKKSDKEGGRWYAYYNITLCHLSLGNLFRAFYATKKADGETPGRWEIYKLKGLIWFAKGKFYNAAESFIESFKTNTSDVTFMPEKKDDAKTWNLIGECFYNLGEYFKAGESFSEASKLCENENFKTLFKKRADLMLKLAENTK